MGHGARRPSARLTEAPERLEHQRDPDRRRQHHRRERHRGRRRRPGLHRRAAGRDGPGVGHRRPGPHAQAGRRDPPPGRAEQPRHHPAQDAVAVGLDPDALRAGAERHGPQRGPDARSLARSLRAHPLPGPVEGATSPAPQASDGGTHARQPHVRALARPRARRHGAGRCAHRPAQRPRDHPRVARRQGEPRARAHRAGHRERGHPGRRRPRDHARRDRAARHADVVGRARDAPAPAARPPPAARDARAPGARASGRDERGPQGGAVRREGAAARGASATEATRCARPGSRRSSTRPTTPRRSRGSRSSCSRGRTTAARRATGTRWRRTWVGWPTRTDRRSGWRRGCTSSGRRILERRLGRLDAARGALERALELDPSVGPVRDALVRHVAAHADWGSLARLLQEEARIESSVARAARLELDAAAICATRLGDTASACDLLAHAASRSPTTPLVDRRVLDELVRLHEREGRWSEAAQARRARLRFVTDPASIAWELRALAAAAEKDDDLDAAIADVQRALAVDATNPTLVEMLDRLFDATGKHDQRVATWLQEAARTEDVQRRSKALARAAQICDHIGRPVDAVRHLRSAWIAAPGEPEVLDSLARLLAPVLSESVDAGARSLVELYAQAAEVSARRRAQAGVPGEGRDALGGAPGRPGPRRGRLRADPGDRPGPTGRPAGSRAHGRPPRGRATALQAPCSRRPASPPTAERSSPCAPGPRGRSSRSTRRARCSSCARCWPRTSGHAAARALETRLEEEAGRWELAGKSLRARIDIAATTAEKVSLWLALAQLQHQRLRRPLDAMQSLEQARALDPSHPVPPEEIARVLEDHGDAHELRSAIERLASHATTPDERARHLARAAGDRRAAARGRRVRRAHLPARPGRGARRRSRRGAAHARAVAPRARPAVARGSESSRRCSAGASSGRRRPRRGRPCPSSSPRCWSRSTRSPCARRPARVAHHRAGRPRAGAAHPRGVAPPRGRAGAAVARPGQGRARS